LTSKKYRKSPIVEAVCEFQFEENPSFKEKPSLESAIPGLVYEKIRTTFPILRQAARITVSVTATPQEVGPQFGTVPLMQFLRKDEKALIQVGSNLLSTNVLRPYPSWQKFLPLIKRGFNAYREVVAPKGIQRIGLRYINQIEIPSQNINLEDYFEFRPFVGSKLPQDFGTFVLGIQVPYEESRDILNLQLVSLPRPNISTDNATMILNLDYVLLKPGEVALDEAFKWVEIAHSHIEDVFEACITQKLRDLFKEVTK
jgi:uncharacterized protein (TIGR04255 family)